MFDWIVSIIDASGLIGIAALMFIENVFPPIPSELVMPLAGFNAARGGDSLLAVVIAGSIGSVAGALFWYGIGRALGARRLKEFACEHGRWLTLTPSEIDRVTAWFHRRGRFAVLIGRLVPTVRTLISVPAGVARMPVGLFTLWSTIGTVAWTALLAGAGFALEAQYQLVAAWLDPISTAVVVGLVGYYLWRVWRFDPGELEAT